MKKIIALSMCVLLPILYGCESETIGIIGGSDGMTSIFVTGSDKNDKDPVRIIRLNDELYYDTDMESEVIGRCGNGDGELKKGCDLYEIPQENNECNFSGVSCYQIGFSENTIEIPDGDDWEIFRKIDTKSDILKYKYCYELEGRMPNAESDSELLVLANEMNITFDEANYVLMGSDTSEMKDIYVMPITD